MTGRLNWLSSTPTFSRHSEHTPHSDYTVEQSSSWADSIHLGAFTPPRFYYATYEVSWVVPVWTRPKAIDICWYRLTVDGHRGNIRYVPRQLIVWCKCSSFGRTDADYHLNACEWVMDGLLWTKTCCSWLYDAEKCFPSLIELFDSIEMGSFQGFGH